MTGSVGTPFGLRPLWAAIETRLTAAPAAPVAMPVKSTGRCANTARWEAGREVSSLQTAKLVLRDVDPGQVSQHDRSRKARLTILSFRSKKQHNFRGALASAPLSLLHGIIRFSRQPYNRSQ